MEELRYVSKYTGEQIDRLLGKVEEYSEDAAAMNRAIQANTQAIGDEETRAKGEEAAINERLDALGRAIVAEETRAKGAEAAINERLDALGLYVDEDGDICQR